jgi:photosystem II stability/assembly factor-like uncharacterized protein
MRRAWFAGGLIVVVAIFLAIAILGGSDTPDKDGLTKVQSFSHAHGLAVDPTDDSRIFIATHEGLYLLKQEQELFRVGNTSDDFMGFSIHPTDGDTFFTSGHPRRGGNLGFQMSTDGGQNWQKVSDGLNGPVDFHAMAVSQVDPAVIYGWYGGLQRTEDGGQNWEAVPTDFDQVIALATDPSVRERLYAATAGGLWISSDKGENWQQIYKETTVAVVLNPTNNKELIISTQGSKLLKSIDEGVTWQELQEPAPGETVLYFAHDQRATKLYALTENNTLFKSEDNASSWTKIR